MNTVVFLALAALIALIAFFLSSDADLPLQLLPAPPRTSFSQQVVWIVGASSGIGASLAQDFSSLGAKVVLSSRRVQQMEDVAKNCKRLYREREGRREGEGDAEDAVKIVPLDVSDLDAHQAAVDEVMKTYGHIDILVLNAGVSQRNTAFDTPINITKDMMHLNFLSLVALNKLVLPSMVERKSGKIVVMSSLSGILGTPIASSYSASKFALHGYFNALRAELSPDNIKVSIICPGPVESEISSKTHRNPNNPVQEEGKKMPTERCTGLIVKGLYHDIDEMWISDQPFLLFTYLTQYFPWLSRQINVKFAGPARIKAIKGGINIYDVKAALGLK